MSNGSANLISAFEFDVVRNAFRSSVEETRLPEHEWERHASDLVRSLTGHEATEELLAALLGQYKNLRRLST